DRAGDRGVDAPATSHWGGVSGPGGRDQADTAPDRNGELRARSRLRGARRTVGFGDDADSRPEPRLARPANPRPPPPHHSLNSPSSPDIGCVPARQNSQFGRGISGNGSVVALGARKAGRGPLEGRWRRGGGAAGWRVRTGGAKALAGPEFGPGESAG